MQGIHSLRELKRLAQLDLGCMWVTGGITPDHANIGRFITFHGDLHAGVLRISHACHPEGQWLGQHAPGRRWHGY
ncbi:hypothetical protein [Azorhizophilus paspali]|uniref:Uncharacterized protein n=1 Tax=Azorhizophilus paspali TaxID=69963 RepID=A0ABV6SK07_AZOPA